MSPAGLPDAPRGHPVSPNDAGPYRAFCYWASAALAVGAGTWMPTDTDLRMAFAATALPLLAFAAACTLRFPSQWTAGHGTWRSPAFWLGLCFIVAGAVFDVATTLWHSPDLQLEANPVAVALLDHGVSVGGVKAYGLLAQALLVLASAMLWSNFCARRGWYLQRLDACADGSLSVHLLGLQRCSLGGLLLGRGADLALLASTVGALMPGLFAYRWYLGLEWWGWVPISRTWAPLACVALAWLGLYAWACHRLTPNLPPASDA